MLFELFEGVELFKELQGRKKPYSEKEAAVIMH